MTTYDSEPIDYRPRGETPGPQPPESHDPDDFWAAFDEAEEWAQNRPTPWYRRSARWFAVLFVAGMVATGALIPWGELFDRRNNVSDPLEIQAIADQAVEDSPYGWLVSDLRVRDIIPSGVAGFVHSSPADGIITIDLNGWNPDDLRSTVAHEIGHLIDFAAYRDAFDRRDGLPSEVWAECAAVDAGYRRTDPGGTDDLYRCTEDELENYRFSLSLLGEICAPWTGECRPITPIGD